MINIKSILKFWKGKDGEKSIYVSKDPVCGMKPTDGIDFIYENVKYSFCSDHCQQQFARNPEAYIIK